MGKNYFIKFENLVDLFGELNNEFELFVPVKKNDQRFYVKYSKDLDNIVLDEVRAFEPLKAFFFSGRGKVAEDFNEEVKKESTKPKCIVGVKACDLKGFKVLDYVFYENDYKDPFYIDNRENNFIISVDCTCTIETCFCTALGINPFPEENFDLNLSKVKDGYAVESGSEKGTQLVEKFQKYFVESTNLFDDEKRSLRDNMIKEVEKNIKGNKIPKQNKYNDIISKNFKSKLWEEESKTCVECGACNTICPTCHCFLLYDQMDKNKMERFRIWDSCMIKDFAKVAGGDNPRKKLWMRLRNRFEKKFDFFPKVANIYACTGCGRCISACPAKIDIRNVLRRLVENV